MLRLGALPHRCLVEPTSDRPVQGTHLGCCASQVLVRRSGSARATLAQAPELGRQTGIAVVPPLDCQRHGVRCGIASHPCRNSHQPFDLGGMRTTASHQQQATVTSGPPRILQRTGSGKADTRCRAARYSSLSRCTNSAAGTTRRMAPIPWPHPQMSFHAFLASPPKFILDGSLSGS